MGKLWLGGVLLLALWCTLSYLVFSWWGVVSAIVVTMFFALLFHYFHKLEEKKG